MADPVDTVTLTGETWDDVARVYTLRDGTGAVVLSRAYTDDENAAIDARLTASAAEDVTEALTAGAVADTDKVEQAISDLAVLLGDATTFGSLRAWKAQPNADIPTPQSLKALVDLMVTEAQATRRVARQTLRLVRLVTGDTSTADVGAP
jgi:hypothetical protein